jgi:hypothetical protein
VLLRLSTLVTVVRLDRLVQHDLRQDTFHEGASVPFGEANERPPTHVQANSVHSVSDLGGRGGYSPRSRSNPFCTPNIQDTRCAEK